MIVIAGSCQKENLRTVVAYVSVDRIYSEPILREFSHKTGIRVLPVYDVEATKTTGLANRLIAEKERPQADVFWSGEFAQTIFLKEKEILAAYRSPIAGGLPKQYLDAHGYWTGVGGRARVLLVNTNLLSVTNFPSSLLDLLSIQTEGKQIGIAYPLFGTSATHAAALYALWGPQRARAFYEALQSRGVRVVDGNSVVRDLVVSGQLSIGLTDTDDACGAIEKGAPVKIVIPDQKDEQMGTLVIPGTVALVAGSPHSEEGKALIDFLISQEVENKLIKSGGSQLPLHKGSTPSQCPSNKNIRAMQVNLSDIFEQLETSKQDLSQIFIR